ncbi:MAG: ABC transporter permease [Methanomicrobiaceae archaeon]|uniref:D-alanyl-d-alanine carboxypeptidase n=1 Tax=hydrocarbon metagenome TaxID=938273 RepID=A0A0W8FGT2_9ZZZZ|nr:ABC transporter permease [Methanomicrobiaceae archaeon]MDD5420381.1 hypothetical protein [Methanomicrobiaceae archaeon]
MVHVLPLAASDLRNVLRDRMLAFAFFIPLLLIFVSVWGIPWISATLFDLSPYHALILSFIFLQVPVLFGFIPAFMLIDERDEHILSALRVLPVSPLSFVAARMFSGAAIAFLYVVLAFALLAGPGVPFLCFLPCACLLALLAPIIALTVVGLSQNKVEALAVFKGLDLLVMLPLVSFFLPPAWERIFWVFPQFWTITAFEELLRSGVPDWGAIGVGLVLHAGVIGYLLRRFVRGL